MVVHSYAQAASNLFLLSFVGGIPLYAWCKKVDIFSEFVVGAKDGFTMAVKIIPYLLGFLVAIGMFRAAGGFVMLAHVLGPLLHRIGFPPELLPMALIRPFSGGLQMPCYRILRINTGGILI